MQILHIEDDPLFADLVSTFLERVNEDFDITTETDPLQALERLDQMNVDCVVSDYDMPNLNGLEVLETVRERNLDVPFILFTGKGSEEIASDAITAGVTDYLQKESGTDQYEVLANRIENAIDQHRSQRKLEASQQRLSLFVDQSPLGVIEWNERFELVAMNETAEDILGYSESDLREESWEVFVPEHERERVREVIDDLLENKGGYHSVNENVRKNGERIVCEWYNRVITDESGEVVALFTQFQDVTDREESNRRLETLVDNLPGMVYRCRIDHGWPMELVGGEYKGLTGYEAGALTNGDVLFETEITHPDDRERVRSEIGRAIENGNSFEVTYRIRTKDGALKWVLERGQGVFSSDGELGALEGFITDVTDQKRHVRKLRENNAVLSTLLEALPMGVLVEDEERTIVAANSTLIDLFGLDVSEDQLLGRDCARAANETKDQFVDPEGFVSGIETLLERRDTAYGEELTLSNGRILERSYIPYDLPDGEANLWLYEDVTERRTSQRTITALHDVAADFADCETPEVIYQRVIDAAAELLELDRSVIAIRDGEYLSVQAMSEEMPLDERPTMRVDEGIAGKTYQNGRSHLIDNVAQAKDAKPQGEFGSAISVPVGDHGVFQAIDAEPNQFDDDDLEIAELLAQHTKLALDRLTHTRELERQNERLENFATIVSHDLRNPLNVLAASLDLAAETGSDEQFEQCRTAIDRMERLIADLLALSRHSRPIERRTELELESVCWRCWQFVETGDAALRVETDRTIVADESRFQQLLENLFRNAVEHGSLTHGSQAAEDANEHDDSVTVTIGNLDDGFYVEDDGPGIPADRSDRIFDPGYTSTEGGTGLGLNIVAEIVDAHGWSIAVSEGESGGARFEITEGDPSQSDESV